MRVTLLVFWDNGWPLLDTESLVSEPLSWSSWISSWTGTLSTMVFCLPRPTVLQQKYKAPLHRACPQGEKLSNRSRNHLLYIFACIIYRFVYTGDISISFMHKNTICTHLLSRFSKESVARGEVSSRVFGLSPLTMTFVWGTTLRAKTHCYYLHKTWKFHISGSQLVGRDTKSLLQ